MLLFRLLFVFLCGLNLAFAKKNCHVVLKELEKCLSDNDGSISNSRQRIAFSATRTTHVYLAPLKTLVFDKVYLNEGKGYNSHTGHFTAPSSGMYHFSVSFLAIGGSTHLLLMKNSHEIARGYGSNDLETGSIVSTVHLKRGDIVRVAEISGKEAEGIHGDNFSSFTGFMF